MFALCSPEIYDPSKGFQGRQLDWIACIEDVRFFHLTQPCPVDRKPLLRCTVNGTCPLRPPMWKAIYFQSKIQTKNPTFFEGFLEFILFCFFTLFHFIFPVKVLSVRNSLDFNLKYFTLEAIQEIPQLKHYILLFYIVDCKAFGCAIEAFCSCCSF